MTELRTEAGRTMYEEMFASEHPYRRSYVVAAIAAIEREASALDVERLARAMHASYLRDPAMPRIYWDELRPDEHAMWRVHAKVVAHAYADLTEGVSSDQHG